MKTIGLIGGMSWESSLEYYRIINETVKKKLGGFHSAKSIMYSVDFKIIEELQHKGKWEELTKIMIQAAKNVEIGGADFVVICTNTMHKMANDIENNIGIPLLHIADATAEKILDLGIKKAGLLGTKFTMEMDFYKNRLQDNYGINVIIPKEKERNIIHEIIFRELCVGKISQFSKNKYIKIINDLVRLGAKGIILGCTEIPLLVKQEDVNIPLFNTTEIHAKTAVEWAMKE